MITEAKLDNLMRYVAQRLPDDEFRLVVARATRYRLTLRGLVRVLAERTIYEGGSRADFERQLQG